MKNKKYCVFCGTSHNQDEKRCKKCLRTLDPKNQPFKEYMLKQGYGEIEDTFLTFLKHYIKSHLYGFLLTCSVILTGASLVTYAISDRTSYIRDVSERPAIFETFDPSTRDDSNQAFFDAALFYVDLLQEGKVDEARDCLLEIADISTFDEITESLPVSETQYTQYEILNNREGLFFMPAEGDYHINKNATEKLYLGKYPSRVYDVHMNYCSFNTCKVENGKEVFDFTIGFLVEVVQIDEKYYIFRDIEAFPFGFRENLLLDVLLANGGDTTQIQFDGIEDRYRSCIHNNTDYYCLKNILH